MSQTTDGTSLYNTLHDLVKHPLKWFNRMEVRGLENLPPSDQGLILAPHHNGMLDAAFVSLALGEVGRAIRWITDDAIANTPLIGEMLSGIGTIPIAAFKGKVHNADQIRKAMAEASDALKNGDIIGLFPAGEIRPIFESREPLPFKAGVLRLGLTSGAPIHPVFVEGADKIMPWLYSTVIKKAEFFLVAPLWLPTKITVHIGPAYEMDPALSLDSSKEDFNKEADRLRDAMCRLMESGS